MIMWLANYLSRLGAACIHVILATEESRMRKILAVSAVALTSVFFTGSAFAQGTDAAPTGARAPEHRPKAAAARPTRRWASASKCVHASPRRPRRLHRVRSSARSFASVTASCRPSSSRLRTGYLFGLSEGDRPDQDQPQHHPDLGRRSLLLHGALRGPLRHRGARAQPGSARRRRSAASRPRPARRASAPTSAPAT